MYCSKCGKENPKNSLFCEECGEKLHSVDPIENTKQKAEQAIRAVVKKGKIVVKDGETRIKKFSPKKIGVGVIAIVLALTLCFAVFHKSDEEKIIELMNTLAMSLEEGDYEKMISCFEPSAQSQLKALTNIGSSLLGSVDLKDMWSLGAVGMSGNNGIYISIHDLRIKKDKASADISFSFDEGKDNAIGTVELVKIKGKWYFKKF